MIATAVLLALPILVIVLYLTIRPRTVKFDQSEGASQAPKFPPGAEPVAEAPGITASDKMRTTSRSRRMARSPIRSA